MNRNVKKQSIEPPSRQDRKEINIREHRFEFPVRICLLGGLGGLAVQFVVAVVLAVQPFP
jgi:hypothetical protein